MVTQIIFSKNRPMQLSLCLSSLEQNFSQYQDRIVIFSCDKEYENAYKTLMVEHPTVMFWNQGDSSIYKTIEIATHTYENKYVCFFTDDCIMYRKEETVNTQALDFVFKNGNVGCFSLRLGANINKRTIDNDVVVNDYLFHTQGSVARASNGMILWNRSVHNYSSYWNYPLSVDGHIFRKNQLIEWMHEIVHLESIKDWKHTPNQFEVILQRFNLEIGIFSTCSEISCVVNSPNNIVQKDFSNSNGSKYPICEHELLKLFEQGKRIKLNKLDISNVECPHTEIDLMKGLE